MMDLNEIFVLRLRSIFREGMRATTVYNIQDILFSLSINSWICDVNLYIECTHRKESLFVYEILNLVFKRVWMNVYELMLLHCIPLYFSYICNISEGIFMLYYIITKYFEIKHANLPGTGVWSTLTSTGCGSLFRSCNAERTVTSFLAEPSNDTSSTILAWSPVFYNMYYIH